MATCQAPCTGMMETGVQAMSPVVKCKCQGTANSSHPECHVCCARCHSRVTPLPGTRSVFPPSSLTAAGLQSAGSLRTWCPHLAVGTGVLSLAVNSSGSGMVLGEAGDEWETLVVTGSRWDTVPGMMELRAGLISWGLGEEEGGRDVRLLGSAPVTGGGRSAGRLAEEA